MLKLLSLIDEHFISKKHSEYYADQLSLSIKRVNELSQKYFSKTVTRMIHEKIIVEARRELAFTSKSVKSIASDLGFQDVAYFSRFYKKSTQQTPQSFRNQWVQ